MPQVLNEVSEDYLSSSLSLILPGVTRGYRHSESSVRKASVFCLVAIHGVVGEQIREHLIKLSSSQVGSGTLSLSLSSLPSLLD